MKSHVPAVVALLCLALDPNVAQCEEIVKTTVCQVVANPPAFDHKLIELTGYASEEMERFADSVIRRNVSAPAQA